MSQEKVANEQVRVAGDLVATGNRGSVYYEPNGYKCNLGYVVRDKEQGGEITYRGPRWGAHIAADTGIPFAEQG